MQKCHDCGCERQWIHSHHIVAKIEGGSDDADNRVGLCANCHEDRHGGPFGGVLVGRLGNSPEARAKKSKTMSKQWEDDAYRKMRQDNLARAMQRKYGVLEIGDVPGRWCWIADACIECGETKRKHASRGLCTACYQRKTWRKYQQGGESSIPQRTHRRQHEYHRTKHPLPVTSK